ncbi:MAG: hypothetical protein NVS9B14_16380 [Candidatus Acidiferrum sp.]
MELLAVSRTVGSQVHFSKVRDSARGRVAEMKKNPAKHKKVRRVPPALVRKNRKDLQLKDYLAEEHPEFGVPLEGRKLGGTGRTSRAKKDGD